MLQHAAGSSVSLQQHETHHPMCRQGKRGGGLLLTQGLPGAHSCNSPKRACSSHPATPHAHAYLPKPPIPLTDSIAWFHTAAAPVLADVEAPACRRYGAATTAAITGAAGLVACGAAAAGTCQLLPPYMLQLLRSDFSIRAVHL
jgi:hypothetical protein